jgi:iron complex transport system permease protein
VTVIPTALRPPGLRARSLAISVVVLLLAIVLATAIGAISLPPGRIALALLDRLPFVSAHSGLTSLQDTVVWRIRLPRVMFAVLVGGLLAMAGAGYQGAFRNPLADPHLLGASQGAGLGATLAIVGRSSFHLGLLDPVPAAAFVGGILAVALAWTVAGIGGGARTPAVLLLAGVAVAAFMMAMQSFVQQHDPDRIREVYAWLLGGLVGSSWSSVLALTPYAAVTLVALTLHGRALDVLAVGDDEAAALGLPVQRARATVIVVATLATAAAVAVSGLIAFVGIVVPHTVRLLFGTSYRVIVPLSFILGGAFLALCDVVARTALAPAELPIGVVTAAIGAPFFVVVLRRRGATGW